MKTYIESQRNINFLYKIALDKSEYIIPPELFLNALFFNTAAAMGLKRMKIKRKTNMEDKLIIPNFFGISMGPPGSGKDHSRNITQSFFAPMFAQFDRNATDFYEANKGTPSDPDKRYLNLGSYFTQVESTEEGIQKTAQTMDAMQHGSVNVVNGELGDVIGRMGNIFKKLKTGWDEGVSEGATTVSDGGANYFTVRDIGFNCLLFGSHQKFETTPEIKDKLVDAYISGMVRRSSILHVTNYKKSENRNMNFEELDRSHYNQLDDYLKDLRHFLNNTEYIIYPKEIWNKLRDYDIEKELIREKSHSLIATDLGSTKKIEKLLGIVAALDLSETITEEHLKFAIKFTEIVDATAESTVEIKPTHIQIYEQLLTREFSSRSDLVKAIKGVNLTTLQNEMVLVEEYANMLGNSLIIKEHSKIVRYKLELLTKADINLVTLSVNTDSNKYNPDGFKTLNGNFFNLHKIINSDKRYSAGTFKDEYIQDSNYIESQNLMIFDIDDGMTIEEAKSLFSDWTYLITTTKSHQKEKKQKNEMVTCDRFRIILPTISTFHLSPTVYSDMYINLLETLGIPAYDEKCRNASRWYYGNPDGEYWYNEGKQLDIRPFIPDSTEQKANKNLVERYEESSYDGDADSRVEGAIKWFLANTASGSRNDMLWKLAVMLKTRVETDDWENLTRHVNTCMADPLNDRELNTIIKSAGSNKYS